MRTKGAELNEPEQMARTHTSTRVRHASRKCYRMCQPGWLGPGLPSSRLATIPTPTPDLSVIRLISKSVCVIPSALARLPAHPAPCFRGRVRFQRLATEMYARGLSTRDIEDAFTDEQGRCLLSRSSTVASSGCSCRRPLFRLLPAPKVFAACQFSTLLQKLNSSASDSVT